jgi:hypothetical protein
MKTLRMVIGIICCVFFLVLMGQSCAVGLGNVLSESGETSGTTGIFVAFLMLIAGILGIAGKGSNGATITAAVFFLVAGLIGTTGAESYVDLTIWGTICYIFCALFTISVIIMKKKPNKNNPPADK